jgi:hypothetical protein
MRLLDVWKDRAMRQALLMGLKEKKDKRLNRKRNKERCQENER